MESRGQFSLSTLERAAGAQTAHHIGPIEVRIDEHRVVFVPKVPGERGAVLDRNVNAGRTAGSYTKEFRCGNARDRKWDVVDAQGLANGP